MMPDREKVLNGLKKCMTPSIEDCVGCPYFNGVNVNGECNSALLVDALELLKQDGCENCAIAIEDRQMVIRCKDCRWWEDGKCENDYVHQQIYDDGCYPDFHTYSEWFCAEGERR